jgi:hypothetical protein
MTVCFTVIPFYFGLVKIFEKLKTGFGARQFPKIFENFHKSEVEPKVGWVIWKLVFGPQLS